MGIQEAVKGTKLSSRHVYAYTFLVLIYTDGWSLPVVVSYCHGNLPLIGLQSSVEHVVVFGVQEYILLWE